MKWILIPILAVTLAACGQSTMTTPTPASQASRAAATYLVSGVVRDAATGAPLAGATVAFTDPYDDVQNDGSVAATDDNGAYNLGIQYVSSPERAAGTLHLTASRAGYQAKSVDIPLAAQSAVNFDLSAGDVAAVKAPR